MELHKFDEKYITGKVCCYCDKPTNFVDSSVIYGQSYGMIYYCSDCRAYVGVHKGSSVSLGRVANSYLRKRKKIAHKFFDHIWQVKKILHNEPRARDLAYAWLSKNLQIHPSHTHIGYFDIDYCEKTINFCYPVYLSLKKKYPGI